MTNQNETNSIYSLSPHLSQNFAHYMTKHLSLYDYIIKKLKHQDITKDAVILDVGSGPGIMLERLEHFFPKASIIGLEPSNEMLSISQKRRQNHGKNIHFIQGIGEKIPIQSKKVDVVICRFSLCYWKNKEKGVQEIFRVLKPKGLLILEVLNKDFSKIKLLFNQINMSMQKATKDVIHYHTEAYTFALSSEDVFDLLRSQNCSILTIEGKQKDWKYLFIVKKQ